MDGWGKPAMRKLKQTVAEIEQPPYVVIEIFPES
jgi:hypothetical protein